MDLSLDCWKNVTAQEQEVIARSLAKQLPSGFQFDSIQEYRLGGQQNRVAFFQKENARFALISGGVVTIGYDSERPWQPNPDELEDWQETAEEYRIDRTIQEHIAEATLRVREVELSPFLIETKTFELGWEALEIEDPEVQEILRKHPTHSYVEVSYGDSSVRVQRKDDGSIIAECSLDCTHAELAADLAISHFRFPTSDEWEFACKHDPLEPIPQGYTFGRRVLDLR
jgi:hypothetical protein